MENRFRLDHPCLKMATTEEAFLENLGAVTAFPKYLQGYNNLNATTSSLKKLRNRDIFISNCKGKKIAEVPLLLAFEK